MDTIVWLAITNAVVWIGLGTYLVFLTLEQRAISARLRQWEKLRSENQIQIHGTEE
ncbi:MAG: CcmD family protein [Desulfovibrio sp.]|jgi:CcmD family protein|nr:CcmD family protein [Desulfovibrio sp.]